MNSQLATRANISEWHLLFSLTLIEIVLRPVGPWTIRPFILALASAGLIFFRIQRKALFWYGLFALIAARIIADWPSPDNHIYLLAYWCLLLALSIRSPEPEFTLKTGARLLVGFAFLLAILWKGLLSPDYVDGRFFRVTFLTDERFASTSMLIGGLSKNQLRENRDYLTPLPEGAELLNPPRLVEPDALRKFSDAATWSALLLESAVAFFFLIPGKRIIERWRHFVLLMFCFVTYPFAPVAGFGWLLLIMGLSQCQPDQRALKIVYVTAYFLILLFAEIPWAGAILDATR
jgi:hypothetical protein